MKNACLLVHCISSFEGTSYKRIHDTAILPVLLFLAVLHRVRIYINRYNFHNFLEPNPIFTGKRFLLRIFIP